MSDPELRLLQTARTLGPTGRGRRVREQARLSLADLAAFVGVDPVTLSRWERGLARPRRPYAQRWAEIVDDLDRLVPAD
jgi:transcriptional regulator with XRE-family HTH domain